MDEPGATFTDRQGAPERTPAELAAYIGDMAAELASLASGSRLTELATSLRYAAIEAARAEAAAQRLASAPRHEAAR